MLWGCYRRFRQKDKIGLIKKFQILKFSEPESPVKPSIQKIGQTQNRLQSLMLQRFPKISKREIIFESHVIW